MKFFLKVLLGIFVGTIFHEIYHFIIALNHNANPRLVFVSYGIGIKSSYHSSEIIAFSITILFTILAFVWAITDDRRVNNEKKV
jgi:hypothetical protein